MQKHRSTILLPQNMHNRLEDWSQVTERNAQVVYMRYCIGMLTSGLYSPLSKGESVGGFGSVRHSQPGLQHKGLVKIKQDEEPCALP